MGNVDMQPWPAPAQPKPAKTTKTSEAPDAEAE